VIDILHNSQSFKCEILDCFFGAGPLSQLIPKIKVHF
jgi:hypothetical protein